jgi:hypothetical protein
LTRLEGRARTRRQSLSAYVRATLFGREDADSAPRQAGSGPGGDVAEYAVATGQRAAERSLTNQLRKVGTNLNQIARRMNERQIPPPRELTMLLDQIRDLVRQAHEA